MLTFPPCEDKKDRQQSNAILLKNWYNAAIAHRVDKHSKTTNIYDHTQTKVLIYKQDMI